MESVIRWINGKDTKPIESGWYMVVLKPVNFQEFDDERRLNGWIEDYGLDKVWFNNGCFWDSKSGPGIDITDRVIYWGNIPTVPLFK